MDDGRDDMTDTITQPAREVPVIGDYDVVVAGGGPAGICACVAAARAGAKTLLIERWGFLGGIATAGWVRPLLGVRPADGRPVIGGVAEELCREMERLGSAAPFDEAVARGRIDFDAEGFKFAADNLVTASGADIRLHSMVAGAVVEDGRLEALLLESRSGRQAVLGKVFVDATGDADVVARAGARFALGRRADGRVQAMGNIFQVGGIDEGRYPSKEEQEDIARRMTEAVERGEIRAYRWHEGHVGPDPMRGQRTFNITHIGGDPTSAEDLTAAEVQARRDAWGIMQWMRREVPGMEDAFIEVTSPAIGVRESRRMTGLDEVTLEDVLSGRKREEAVARCSFGIDIHCPMARVKGRTFTCSVRCDNRQCHMFTEHAGELPGDTRIAGGSWYDIPYGALVSADLANLLACGRCVAADHAAMSSLRVMGPSMSTGQAAGTAAALAADAGVTAAEVNVTQLQFRLREDGAAV
ncbi:MAG: FAD-dependent oxidoreductase [Armatimonadetes bacterium]|nr:FAD-dependent oxidoreductase [Armatimonadota bacterium]